MNVTRVSLEPNDNSRERTPGFLKSQCSGTHFTSFVRTLFIFMLMGFASGCFTMRDAIDDFTIDTRNQAYARFAWRKYRASFHGMRHHDHIENGFKAGYVSVASGGSGCPPTLPPRKYWSGSYQNPKGHEKMRDWFHGYSFGVLAAKQDGIADWNRLVTSPFVSQNLHLSEAHPAEIIDADSHSQELPPEPDAPDEPVLELPPVTEVKPQKRQAVDTGLRDARTSAALSKAIAGTFEGRNVEDAPVAIAPKTGQWRPTGSRNGRQHVTPAAGRNEFPTASNHDSDRS